MTSNLEAKHFNFEKSLDELEGLIAKSENGEIDDAALPPTKNA